MAKIDFKKLFKELYTPPKKFVVIDVPEMQFLMVNGHGDPNISQDYQNVVEALYAISYKLKFASKKKFGKDYVVPPLEGLWWAEDMDAFTISRDKSQWDWIMMMMVPEWITSEMFSEARGVVAKTKNLVGLDQVRLESYSEGLCVQIMHIGGYDDEGPLLKEMHYEYLPKNGFVENGKHHEIYLSDPRRISREKLKTVLRQPIRHMKSG